MKSDELDDASRPPVPRTATVLVFLAAFAVIASWLTVYAGTNALIAADVIRDWPTGTDPRPRWMLNAFISLFSLFTMVGLLFRWVSGRQLKRIDAMAEAEDSHIHI